MSESFICNCLIEADAQVASEELCAFERKPERMMHLEASEVEELQAEPDFKKARPAWNVCTGMRGRMNSSWMWTNTEDLVCSTRRARGSSPDCNLWTILWACRRRSRLSCRDRSPISLSSWAPVCRRRNMCCSGHWGRVPPTQCTSLAAHTAWFKKIFTNRISLWNNLQQFKTS